MKLRYLIFSGFGAIAITLASVGVVSATSNTSSDIGSSGIPRSVFKQDRLNAVAEVLNTTTANVQAARKDHTLAGLISSAGLTRQTFVQKVKTDLTKELESQGYSQDQITVAVQHRTIVKLRHKLNN